MSIFSEIWRAKIFSHADTDILSAEETILSLCFAALIKQEASEGEAELHTKKYLNQSPAVKPLRPIDPPYFAP